MIGSRKSKDLKVFPHIVLAIVSLITLFPFVILISSSFTDETALLNNGYALFPTKFSLDAYQYILSSIGTIGTAYGITFINTIVGTTMGLLLTTLTAYPLARKDLPKRGIFLFLVVFTMLFNGGLVPSYLMWTEFFHIKNTLFAYIFPGLLTNAFYIIMMKTYFQNSIPPALTEAAEIDGASEFTTLFKIVIPLSLPIMATIGLFIGLGYWNDWMNGLYYITNEQLYSMQVMLNHMIQDIQFLSNNLSNQNLQVNIPTTGVRMAIALVASIPIMIVYPFFQKYFAKGIMIGAVKG